MMPGPRTWLAAVFAAAAIHFAIAVGFKVPTQGAVEPPAGAPVEMATSLAGIMGGVTATEPEPVETELEPEPVEEEIEPEPPEPVQTARAETVEAVTPVAPVQARSETVNAIAAQVAEAAPEIETLASVDPTVVPPEVTPVKPVESVQQRQERIERRRQAERRRVERRRRLERQRQREVERRRRIERERRAERRRQAERRRRAERQRRARERRAAARQRAQRAAERRRANARRAGTGRRGSAGRQRGGRGGRSSASAGAIASYGAQVRARILRNRPGAGGRGRVVVSFGVTPGGRLSYARVSRSSGNPSLDRAALSAVRRTSFPRPPRGARTSQLRFSISFSFR